MRTGRLVAPAGTGRDDGDGNGTTTERHGTEEQRDGNDGTRERGDARASKHERNAELLRGLISLPPTVRFSP